MGHWAVVENDTIVNVAECDDPTFAQDQGWVPIDDLDPKPWIGWTYIDGEWYAPVEDV